MKRVRLITAAAVLAVTASIAVAAQNTNTSERTFLTFSAAVEMPGVTLQPGKYVFKLADTPSRNVVQVWDGDEKNMIGHWLFVPAQRAEVTEDTVVMFKENREGTTPAVQYWYYPGERNGKEFVYPKDQATQIAARTGVDVLSTTGSVDSGDARVSSIDAKGNVTEWQREPASASASASRGGVIEGSPVAAEPAPQAEAESALRNAPSSAQPSAPAGSLAGNRGLTTQSDNDARVSAPEPVAAAPEPAEPRVSASARTQSEVERPVGTSGVQAEGQVARADALPQTAGVLPLTGLLGLLSLAGAYGVRSLRRS
jgi:hypothetical protein